MSELSDTAKEWAKDIEPPTWDEDGDRFFYPTLDNCKRVAIGKTLSDCADRIESLEAENAALRVQLELMEAESWEGTALALAEESRKMMAENAALKTVLRENHLRLSISPSGVRSWAVPKSDWEYAEAQPVILPPQEEQK